MTSQLRLSGTNLERVADHNQRTTLHAIRVYGSLTRVELARITGLTAPAIANITRRLLLDGLIEEAGRRRGGRGQPPTKLVVRPDACHAVGINVDRDHVTAVLVDFAGRTLARDNIEQSFALPDDVHAFSRRALASMLRRTGVGRESLVGLGVAIPDQLAMLDLPGRPSAYAAWDGVDIGALLGEPVGLPVFVENDAAAAAMGEMQLGLGQRYSSFFYVLISSGLGGGLVIDGAYWRGAEGRSGELGFMRTTGHDGGEVQVQTLVSLAGLAAHLRADGLELAAVTGTDDLPASVEASVGRWIERAALSLRAPLDAVNCLVNPATILIGGRLPVRLVERLAARVDAVLREDVVGLTARAPVARAALSEDAPAVGAAILPFSHFLLPRTTTLWKAPASAVSASMEQDARASTAASG